MFGQQVMKCFGHPNCLSPQEKINSSCSRWRCPSLISVEYYPHLHRFSPLHMSQMCFCNPRARIERCSSCFANVWCRLHHDLRYGVRGGDQIDSTWTSMNVGAANWIRLDIVRPQNPRRPKEPRDSWNPKALCALQSRLHDADTPRATPWPHRADVDAHRSTPCALSPSPRHAEGEDGYVNTTWVLSLSPRVVADGRRSTPCALSRWPNREELDDRASTPCVLSPSQHRGAGDEVPWLQRLQRLVLPAVAATTSRVWHRALATPIKRRAAQARLVFSQHQAFLAKLHLAVVARLTSLISFHMVCKYCMCTSIYTYTYTCYVYIYIYYIYICYIIYIYIYVILYIYICYNYLIYIYVIYIYIYAIIIIYMLYYIYVIIILYIYIYVIYYIYMLYYIYMCVWKYGVYRYTLQMAI